MGSFDATRLIIAILFTVILLVFITKKLWFKKLNITPGFITKTAIFAAFSVILYAVPYLKFTLPIFPGFLEIHLDEVPTLIASLGYGPLSGIFILIVKTLIKLPLTSTMGVGELIDFIYSFVFIIPAALIYKKHRTIKGAFISILIGGLFQLLISSFMTSFVMLYFYMSVFGLSEETIIAMCHAINPNVNSLGMTFLIFVALPFNALKDGIVIVITFLLYKRIKKIFDRI